MNNRQLLERTCRNWIIVRIFAVKSSNTVRLKTFIFTYQNGLFPQNEVIKAYNYQEAISKFVGKFGTIAYQYKQT
jgi:hypothetical protein